MSTGTLYGVGLGPGDPELITLKAARLIAAADVIAYHSARHGRSIARGVAAAHLRGDQIEEQLVYPLTVETTDHPGGYRGAIADFYTESAAKLATHLDAGRDVVLLCEGDPLFYGSYMHMHTRLAGKYPTEVVPGVTSVSGAAAVTRRPLVEGEEVLTVLPGTLSPEELTTRLTGTGPAAVLKLGRNFEKVRKALTDAGRLDEAVYVERATWEAQRVAPLSEVDPDSVPYFALALLPSGLAMDPAPAPARAEGPGEVAIVGLGPAGRPWLTPEAQETLAWADDLVGYGPYLDRVPPNPRQRRHASGNTVEAERAALALELARAGSRVVVVSSGDPGVFAMASAVLEVADDARWADVPVRVVPGLTAAQAVASRAGAPLGHDFCTLSLSDRLKPWDVIASRLAAAAAADFVIAIYNPASRTRRDQLVAAKDVLLTHRSPDTPVIVGRDVGGTEETVEIVRLAEFDPATVDMRCLLIVGSSRTRITELPDGTRRVFTPRHYPAS
jgi:precorrin-2 C20-methyltransferase/precorrin-3B C17-methyltransferase